MAVFRGRGIALQSASIFLLVPIQNQISKMRSQCELEEQGRAPSKQISESALPEGNKQQDNEEQSCAACLYTGVATCTGLALYFAKVALLEVPDITRGMPREVAVAHGRSRMGFLAMSAVWVGIGAYRWHLG
jgi:hypothetical protein